jgi:hypothetical protein
MKYDQAVKVLRQYHSKDPANLSVLRRLSSIYDSLGDEKTAAFWNKRRLDLMADTGINLNRRINLLIAQEKWQEAESFLMDNFSPANASDIGAGPYFLMHHDFKEERFQAPMNRYKYLFPQVFEEGYNISEDINPWIHKDIAVSLLAVGQTEKADNLIRQLIEYPEIIEYRVQGNQLLVLLHSLVGDLDAALKIIQEDTLSWAAWYTHPDLENLRGHPEFEALMKEPLLELEEQSKRLEEQRQRLVEWEANGELAPIPPLPVK